MNEKQQRKGFLGAMDRLIVLLDGVKGIAMILAALSVGGASGTFGTILAGGKEAARTDSLEVRVDSLETNVGQMQANQLEMFSAQIEADSTLKAVLESRAANRRKAAESRANTQKMFNDITGGSP